MAESNAIAALGIVFSRWNTTSSSWEPISEISGIGGPGKSRDTIEVTHFQSLDSYREYIGGLREGGTVPLTMNFTRATFDILNADFEDDAKQVYKIELPDDANTTFEFQGLVTELPLGAEIGDKVTADCTIQVSGKVEVLDGGSGAPTVLA